MLWKKVSKMPKPSSRFRLQSSAFARNDETEKINPKRMIFLSVEGDETERTYFQNLNEYLDTNLIQIEVLRHRRGDGYSDPVYVIELLEEYIDVRQGGLIPDELPTQFTEKYSKEFIQKYLANDSELTIEERKQFSGDLLKIGIDIEYRRYLQSFRQDMDYFAVVLDRDCGSHSKQLMQECLDECNQHNYGCLVTNPCFEFWLLLHLCDVKSEFSPEELESLYSNPTISKKHTKVSYEVSKRAHHTKTISSTKFKNLYYPNIPQAIKNAESFSTDFPDLFDNFGSNLPKLLSILGFQS